MEAPLSTSSTPDWQDDDLVLISAIEHWSYCPRQCALIHLEQTYDENIFTLRGNRAHEKVHQESVASEDGVRIVRELPLWSNRLGLIGKSDVVEWHGATPYPVEYKVGKRRNWAHEMLQLCAQAMCLEEMLGVAVPAGAVYYAGSKRRRKVIFGEAERKAVAEAVVAIRVMLQGEQLPIAIDDSRCPNCSLVDACAPGITAHPAVIRGHFSELFRPND